MHPSSFALVLLSLFQSPTEPAQQGGRVREPAGSFSIGGDSTLRGFAFRGAAPRVAQEQRAWLGVSLQIVEGGVEVLSVVEGSPAARAELKAGDRLVSLGDTRIGSYEALVADLRERQAGDQVALRFERNLEVRLSSAHKDGERFLLGVYLAEATGSKGKEKDRDSNDDQSAAGARVTRTNPEYPAARAGIVAGDVLLAVDGVDVHDSDSVVEALADADGKHDVTVRIARVRTVELGRAQSQTVRPFERMTPPRQPARPAQPAQPALPRSRAVPEGLEDELRALSSELRELREQVARLRSEIDRLRAR